MKLLVISHEFPPIGGGGANACYYLTSEYVKRGHEVTVVTAAFEELPREECINGVNIVRVKAKRKKRATSDFFEMLTYFISATLYIWKMLQKRQFDFCQVFFGIPSGPIALIMKKKYGLPYLIRLGGGDIPGAQKRFRVLYKVLKPFIRSVWKNATCLVANSEDLQKKAYSFEERYTIQIVSNGVDCSFFSPQIERNANGNNSKCKILFVSRLIEGKGLQFIIPHLKYIAEQVSREIELIVVGDGPFRKELEDIAKHYCVEENVFFEGMKSKQELLKYYRDSDLFILPSLSEGMPNVVLEAMATGLPVIMTPCGGSKELITDNGFVVELDEFVEKIVYLCCHPDLMKQMGKRGTEITREKFSWSMKAEEYQEIFMKGNI